MVKHVKQIQTESIKIMRVVNHFGCFRFPAWIFSSVLTLLPIGFGHLQYRHECLRVRRQGGRSSRASPDIHSMLHMYRYVNVYGFEIAQRLWNVQLQAECATCHLVGKQTGNKSYEEKQWPKSKVAKVCCMPQPGLARQVCGNKPSVCSWCVWPRRRWSQIRAKVVIYCQLKSISFWNVAQQIRSIPPKSWVTRHLLATDLDLIRVSAPA